MKSVDVNSNTYIDFSIENHDKDPKFKIDHYVKTSRHKNNFGKSYDPNSSEEVFVIKKVRNTAPWTYVIEDLHGKEIVAKFY